MAKMIDRFFDTVDKPLQLTEAFKALGDNNRLKIVRMLCENEMCAIEILDKLEISQPTLSHHMKVLVNSTILKTRKTGAQVNYSINKKALKEVEQFIGELAGN